MIYNSDKIAIIDHDLNLFRFMKLCKDNTLIIDKLMLQRKKFYNNGHTTLKSGKKEYQAKKILDNLKKTITR